jgi:hypothetical protein
MNNRYLVPALAKTPATFDRLIRAIPADQWDTVTEEGRFTVREAIAHLADWEPILRGRLETALQKPGSTIITYDEGDRAVEKNYGSAELLATSRAFADERAKTVALVESISDWTGTVLHPEQGLLSVADLATIMLGHDVYHIEHLTEYLSER